MPQKTLSKGGGFSCESPRLSLTFCLLHCFQTDAKALFESFGSITVWNSRFTCRSCNHGAPSLWVRPLQAGSSVH